MPAGEGPLSRPRGGARCWTELYSDGEVPQNSNMMGASTVLDRLTRMTMTIHHRR